MKRGVDCPVLFDIRAVEGVLMHLDPEVEAATRDLMFVGVPYMTSERTLVVPVVAGATTWRGVWPKIGTVELQFPAGCVGCTTVCTQAVLQPTTCP